MRPAVTFQITAVYQMRPGLFRVRVLVASRGHFSGRSPCHSGLPQVPFLKIFADKIERLCCANKNCKCYIKCNESPEISGEGNVMHNHDADSEACLNRQIFNNSVKRKATEDLCERPRKRIHDELLSQYLDSLTYKDIRNTSRNMLKARSSQPLPLPTDTEEIHEALNAVQVLTSSTELTC